ncbi:MAG: hypothetical protein AMXMBFR82_50150 [Candidatus Hydrogenedentota bacterium]
MPGVIVVGHLWLRISPGMEAGRYRRVDIGTSYSKSVSLSDLFRSSHVGLIPKLDPAPNSDEEWREREVHARISVAVTRSVSRFASPLDKKFGGA